VLAGGIAHDFNNILTALWGNISLARHYASGKGRVTERLEEAEKALGRAKDLTNQLLTFSKGGAPIKKAASLLELVRESASFALRGSRCRLIFDSDPNLWTVEIDEGQISQVINNIVLNAKQAMPGGGTVCIKAFNVNPDEARQRTTGHSHFVALSISDDGVGIPESIRDKIFDPYFTTKDSGTGLGLATSYSIVKRHGGRIEFKSNFGKGSSFTVYLPAALGKAPARRLTPLPIKGGQGKILILDDEASVREVMVAQLGNLGYTAYAVENGQEAIDAYRDARDKGFAFDAVIVDLTIPAGMGGLEALEKLKEIDADVKALVFSGYSNDPIIAQFDHYGFSGVIPKPYTVEELAEAIGKAVAAS
jgi:CheY-like chemotaxis protein